jgi:glyoxylate reductase
MGVGYDHVDVAAATARGIAVGHTPGTLDETVADLTFALLLATARNLFKGDRYIRRGAWKVYDPNIFWGAEVHGSTLGIIGLGRIGRAVARRARGFNMKILYHNRTRNPAAEAEVGAQYVSLAEVLAQSDFVVVMVPYAVQTYHLIGPKELAQMKQSAILVNTARGPIVDSQALYEALRDGVIAGAGLDVFDPEPPDAADPLLALDNVVLTPHLGSASVRTRTGMGLMSAENLLAGLRGQPLPYGVNLKG